MSKHAANRFSRCQENVAKRTRVEDRTVHTYLYGIWKKFVDIVISLIGLVFFLPIFPFLAIAIKLDTPGPVFYIQERVGKNGKVFKIYKLRSMVVDAEKNGAQWADENDKRVTRVGRFLRKTRLDEFPQLVNVLKNEMSIIGPRPERPELTEEFCEYIAGFANRLQVRPGLTGWAQVNGGYDLTPEEKFELDMYYIENRSIMLDLLIIFKTIGILFTGNGAR